jgi:deoxycytidine triphosphate deaminase
MPTLVTGEKLRDGVQKQTFIEGGDVKSVEGVKYDFHMGRQILKAKYGQPIDIEDLPAVDKSTLAVDPGEVVFVLTQEKLNLPKNMIAILSSKRKLAHGGIIILGGLTIDPLYNNYLQVGLYNFSSTPFPLRPGKKLIAAMFYELEAGEMDDFSVPESTRAEGFGDELIGLIRNYRPIEIKGVYDELQDTKRQLQELRTSITDDKQWKDDFKTALDSHNSQLDKIIDGLEKEIKAREKGDTEVLNKLDQVSSIWSTFKASFNLGGWIIAAIIGAAISAAVSHFIK